MLVNSDIFFFCGDQVSGVNTVNDWSCLELVNYNSDSWLIFVPGIQYSISMNVDSDL